jgi:hypothetical protein
MGKGRARKLRRRALAAVCVVSAFLTVGSAVAASHAGGRLVAYLPVPVFAYATWRSWRLIRVR